MSAKAEAKKLRVELKRHGFTISSAIDSSIELCLNKTTSQIVEAGVEAKAKEHFLPGFLCVTQDYVIFSKASPYPLHRDQDDIFEIMHRPNLSGEIYHRMTFEKMLKYEKRLVGLVIDDLSPVCEIADYLRSLRRPNDPPRRIVPNEDGPPL